MKGGQGCPSCLWHCPEALSTAGSTALQCSPFLCARHLSLFCPQELCHDCCQFWHDAWQNSICFVPRGLGSSSRPPWLDAAQVWKLQASITLHTCLFLLRACYTLVFQMPFLISHIRLGNTLCSHSPHDFFMIGPSFRWPLQSGA